MPAVSSQESSAEMYMEFEEQDRLSEIGPILSVHGVSLTVLSMFCSCRAIRTIYRSQPYEYVPLMENSTSTVNKKPSDIQNKCVKVHGVRSVTFMAITMTNSNRFHIQLNSLLDELSPEKRIVRSNRLSAITDETLRSTIDAVSNCYCSGQTFP